MNVLRTMLFAPGNHPRRTEKAFTTGADAVILDLEDACPVSEKIASRTVVTKAIGLPRTCLGYIRVNPLSTAYGYGDIASVIVAGLDGIVLPKVESADEIKTADWLVAQIERERQLPSGSIDILPIIETGKGFVAIRAIAESKTRIKRLAFGGGDFTLDMNIVWTREETELLYSRSAMVQASRAAGLEAPIDTVWVNIQDKDGFAASTERSRNLGFQGKLCIYPDQIPVANAAFRPSAEQLSWSRRIIDAFAAAEAGHSAAIQLDGQFIDYPILYRAQRVLATEAAIAMRSPR